MEHIFKPALGGKGDRSPWVQGQPVLQSKFQDSQDWDIEEPCLEKPI